MLLWTTLQDQVMVVCMLGVSGVAKRYEQNHISATIKPFIFAHDKKCIYTSIIWLFFGEDSLAVILEEVNAGILFAGNFICKWLNESVQKEI